jgi:hypothetical protein
MKRILACLSVAFLIACSNAGDPGPLKGTWKAGGILPHSVTFRSGEMESMGMVDKVTYKTDGNSVLVTATDGLMKGTAARYQLIDAQTIHFMNTTYKKSN